MCNPIFVFRLHIFAFDPEVVIKSSRGAKGLTERLVVVYVMQWLRVAGSTLAMVSADETLGGRAMGGAVLMSSVSGT